MPIASANPFPSMLYVEGTTPSSPSAGQQRLFVRSSDHVLCMVNSSGTVTALSGSLTNPMTTAQDIIVGGSAGAPGRLAIGAAGASLGVLNSVVAYNSGTSMPGSKATGDRYWRTDLGQEFYWDGTRWLTTQEYSVEFHPLDALDPFTIGTGSDTFWCMTDPGLSGQWLTRLAATTMLSTNNGSNFATVQLKSYNAARTGHNLGSTFNTSGDTASNFVQHAVTIGALVTSGDTYFTLFVTKTGSPSTIYTLGTVFYRLVGT